MRGNSHALNHARSHGMLAQHMRIVSLACMVEASARAVPCVSTSAPEEVEEAAAGGADEHEGGEEDAGVGCAPADARPRHARPAAYAAQSTARKHRCEGGLSHAGSHVQTRASSWGGPATRGRGRMRGARRGVAAHRAGRAGTSQASVRCARPTSSSAI